MIRKYLLGFLFACLIATSAAQATTGVSGSPFSLLGLNNAWTGAQTHSGAESFSNASTNFSSGAQLFGVAATPVNVQTFTATGAHTWTKPTSGGHLAFIEMWQGGQSGAVRSTTGNAGGGTGGNYYYIVVPLSSLASTETATVGAGGAAVASSNANGNVGGMSTFTVNGVTFTPTTTGQSAPTNAASGVAAAGGAFPSALTPSTPLAIQGGIGGDVTTGNLPEFINGSQYTNSFIGGAAGGASSSTAGGTRTGGTSFLGGAGGNGGANTGGAGGNGTQPGGGGGGAVAGGASGKGGDGQIRVTVF